MTTEGVGPAAFFYILLIIILVAFIRRCLLQGFFICSEGDNVLRLQQDREGEVHSRSLQQNQSFQNPKQSPSSTHDEEINERPSLGRILLPTDEHNKNIEKNGTVDTNTGIDNEKSGIQLAVDFGDFEVLPIEETSCPICLTEYENGDRIQRSAAVSKTTTTTSSYCDHVFHQKCIVQWMETKTSTRGECPICRRHFVVGTGGQEKQLKNN